MRTDQQPIRIALFAPEGCMGRAIRAAIAEDPGFELNNDHGEVLVDFSAPDALRSSLDRAISAGVPLLVEHLVGQLPAGPLYFAETQRSDQSPSVILAELVREQVLARTREEVPHAVEVEVEEITHPRPDLVRIEAVLLTETESQKGILIGAGIFRVTGTAYASTGPSVILGYLVLAPAVLATSVAYSVFLSTPLEGLAGAVLR